MAETEEGDGSGVADGAAAAGAVQEDGITPSERETIERFKNMSQAERDKWIRDDSYKRMLDDRLSYIP